MSDLLRRASLRCWLVVDDAGREAVFVDQSRAEQYAADHRGVIVAGNRLARQGQSELTGLLGLGAETRERNA